MKNLSNTFYDVMHFDSSKPPDSPSRLFVRLAKNLVTESFPTLM